MITCLGKSCIFALLCVFFVTVYQILCKSFFPFFCLEGGMTDVIVFGISPQLFPMIG